VSLLPFLRRELSVEKRGWQAARQALHDSTVRTVSLGYAILMQQFQP